MNIDLLRTKWNENWTFWGSPFSITIWQVYTYRPVAGPRTHYALLWNIIYKFGFKIQPVDRLLFCKSKEHFLQVMYSKN